MRRSRNVKIVATLGPASSTPEMILALFEAGADVFRLNFSHGTHKDHEARFEAIRRIETMTGRPIGILMDLQGRNYASVRLPKVPSTCPSTRNSDSISIRLQAAGIGCVFPIQRFSRRSSLERICW